MSLESLKILYTSFDEVPRPKGASTHIEAFVRTLGARFGDVWLVTPGPADQPTRDFAPGVRQKVLGCPDDNPIGRARTFRAKLIAWLARCQINFDVIHFRSIMEGWSLLAPQVRRGAKLVHEVNGFPSIEMKYHYRKVTPADPLTAKLFEQELDCLDAADLIVTVSDVNRQEIVSRGVPPERIVVIRNGVDLERFPFQVAPPVPSSSVSSAIVASPPASAPPASSSLATPSADSTPPEPLRLAYVGTLTIWQGIETLLEAVELLSKQRPVRLRLLGAASPSRRRELDRVVRHLRIEESVEFLTSGDHEAVVRLLHDSHASVVPLLAVDRNVRQGCCPLKLLESFAAGCPVIASDLPVVNELGRPDEHFLSARAGDARSLKNALVRLTELADGGRAMARRAADHVRSQFTWTRAGERLVAEYERLMTGADATTPACRAES